MGVWIMERTMQTADKKYPPTDLDTAISMAGLGKFHVGLVILAGSCLATITADTMIVSFALPTVECEMELSAANKGVLSGVAFLGMFLASHIWGIASDTYGRRRVLILSLGIGWLLAVSASLAPTFWLIVILRFLAGAAYSGMASIFYTYLTEFLPPKQRARFLVWVFLFESAMFGLMPVVAWLTLPLTWTLNLGFVVVGTWRILFLVNTLYALVTLLAALRFPESPKYLVSVGKDEEAIDVLGRVFSINTGHPRNEYPVDNIVRTTEDQRTVQIEANAEMSCLTVFKTMKQQTVPIFGRQHLRATLLGCFLEFCVYSSCYGFFLWVPDILNDIMSYKSESSNASATVCEAMNPQREVNMEHTCQGEVDSIVYVSSLVLGALYCVSYTLIGVLLKLVGERTLFAVLQFLGGIAGVGIYWATDSILLAILLTAYVLLPTISSVLLSAIVVDLYPTHLRSTALCIVLSSGRLGASLTGYVIGSIFEYNCTMAIFGLAAMSFASGLLSFLIPKATVFVKLDN